MDHVFNLSGKSFAYCGLKLALANILQRFRIEADGTVPELEIRADVSVRPIGGYNVRLRKRVWSLERSS